MGLVAAIVNYLATILIVLKEIFKINNEYLGPYYILWQIFTYFIFGIGSITMIYTLIWHLSDIHLVFHLRFPHHYFHVGFRHDKRMPMRYILNSGSSTISFGSYLYQLNFLLILEQVSKGNGHLECVEYLREVLTLCSLG